MCHNSILQIILFYGTPWIAQLRITLHVNPYRISRSLHDFATGWNDHPIRTANHKSPLQLFTAGMLLLQNSQLSALDFFDNVDELYGVNPNGSVPIENAATTVDVPQSSLHFSNQDMQTLKLTVDPCAASDNYGIDIHFNLL